MPQPPSGYRPSGMRKGQHLRGAERIARWENMQRIFRDKLKHLHGHYMCIDRTCGAPLASLVYGETKVETAEAIWTVPTATLTCKRGHIREETLR